MVLTTRAEETWRGGVRWSEGEDRGAAAAGSVPPDRTMMGLYYPSVLPVSWPPTPLPELICTVDSLAKETHLACTVQQVEERMMYVFPPLLVLLREPDSVQVRSLTA